tara:strand:+ start:1273 stop:1551 length:279 start_codon:yes stop_codon:yes gene_type:complete
METINIKPLSLPNGIANQLILNVGSISLPFQASQVLSVGVGITDSSLVYMWGCSVAITKAEYDLWNTDTYLIDLCITKANEQIENDFLIEKI